MAWEQGRREGARGRGGALTAVNGTLRVDRIRFLRLEDLLHQRRGTGRPVAQVPNNGGRKLVTPGRRSARGTCPGLRKVGSCGKQEATIHGVACYVASSRNEETLLQWRTVK